MKFITSDSSDITGTADREDMESDILVCSCSRVDIPGVEATAAAARSAAGTVSCDAGRVSFLA